MAYTADQILAKIATLEASLTAVEATTYSDRSIKYRRIEEITGAIAYWNTRLANLQQRPRTHFGVGNSGFNS